MRAHHLHARAGWHWIQAGFALFRKQPFTLVGLVLTFVFVLLSLAMVPVLGLVVLLFAMPGLGCGFMYAGRDTQAGVLVTPMRLFAAFREPGRGRSMWALGGIYFAIVIVATLIMLAFDDGALAEAVASGALQQAEGDLPVAVQRAALFAAVLQVFVTLVFWFAPILVAWHGVPAVKALFFSAIAVWRCRAAFLVYGVSALAVMLIPQAALSIVLSAFDVGPSIQLMISMPISAAAMALLHCSAYISYLDAFGLDTPDPTAPGPAPAD
jgi:hypothetical protein